MESCKCFAIFLRKNCNFAVKSKSLETEYERLSKKISDTCPEGKKMMEIAFKYFYDGVNIDGGYCKQIHK